MTNAKTNSCLPATPRARGKSSFFHSTLCTLRHCAFVIAAVAAMTAGMAFAAEPDTISSTGSAEYGAGQTIHFFYALDDSVTSVTPATNTPTNTPYLVLSGVLTGSGAPARATYTGIATGDHAGAMEFVYTVAPGDFSAGVGIASFSRDAATINTADEGPLNGDVIPQAANILAGETITIKTITASPLASPPYYTGDTLSIRVSLGGATDGDQTFTLSSSASGKALPVSSTLTINDGSASGEFDVNLLGATGDTPVVITIHPDGYGTATAGDIKVSFSINEAEAPAIVEVKAYATDDGTYDGGKIQIEVVLNGTITDFSGTPPTLNLSMDPSARTATLDGEMSEYKDESSLFFTYTIKSGDAVEDLCCSAGTFPGGLYVNNKRLTRAAWNAMPKNGAVGSLSDNADIRIETIKLGSSSTGNARSDSLRGREGDTLSVTITRDGHEENDPSTSLSFDISPSISGKIEYGSFTIPRGEREAVFEMTLLEKTDTPVILTLHPNGYKSTAGDIKLTIDVEQGDGFPTTVSGPTTLDESKVDTWSFTISVERKSATPLIYTLTTTNVTARPGVAAPVISPTTVTIPANGDSTTFSVSPKDGQWIGTIVATPDSNRYRSGQIQVTVANVPPTTGSEGTTRENPQPAGTTTAGQLFYLPGFNGSDVAEPDDGDKLRWHIQWGDGTDVWYNNHGSIPPNTLSHIYVNGDNTDEGMPNYIVVTVHDKDGQASNPWYGVVYVKDNLKVLVNEYRAERNDGEVSDVGRNVYKGLDEDGFGYGKVFASGYEATMPREVVAEAAEFNWIVKFAANANPCTLAAVPESYTDIGPDYDGVRGEHEYNSYFHVWLGEEDAFRTASCLIPLSAPRTAAVILRDGGEVVERQVGAVFAREYYPEDNYADIDHDRLPDVWERQYLSKLVSEDAEDTYPFESVLGDFGEDGNPDGDFFPACATVNTRTGEFTIDGNHYEPTGAPFWNVYEVRGTHPGLNARDSDPVEPVDEPHQGQYDDDGNFTDLDGRTFFGTNPTKADTDDDLLTDGYEYFFWRWAFSADPVGEAYDGTQVIAGTPIDNAKVQADFNPCVYTSHLSRDTDEDGLTNFEEFLLGTNPIHWDTDGDKMNDGWEVMWGLDPFSNDADGNPDGDYMACDADVSGSATRTIVTVTLPNGVDPEDPSAWLSAVTNTVDVAELDPIWGDAGQYEWMPIVDDGDDDVETYVSWIDETTEGDPTAPHRHYDVYNRFGFDPRTAWTGRYLERNRKLSLPAPNTKEFSNFEEYYLARWLIDRAQIAGYGDLAEVPPMSTVYMTQPVPYGTRRYYDPGWKSNPNHVPDHATKAKPTEEHTIRETEEGDSGKPYTIPYGITLSDPANRAELSFLVDSIEITTHGCDSDADGMPDGWELYVCAPAIDFLTGMPIPPEEAFPAPDFLFWPTKVPDIPADAPANYDDDTLSNREECHATELCDYYGSICTNGVFASVNGNWYNKWWPCNPWSGDTDGDHLADSDEGDATFRYQTRNFTHYPADGDGTFTSVESQLAGVFGDNTMLRGHVPGGGLNPNAVDTDMDYLPDAWEYQYAGTNRDTDWEGGFCNQPGTESSIDRSGAILLNGCGMDGTYFDSRNAVDEVLRDNVTISNQLHYVDQGGHVFRDYDFDGDGLENYQEYWINAMGHLQYDKWAYAYYTENGGKRPGYGTYDPNAFFVKVREFASDGSDYPFYNFKAPGFGYLNEGTRSVRRRGKGWESVPQGLLTFDWSAYCEDWQNAGQTEPSYMFGLPIYPFAYMPSENRPWEFGPALYASSDPRLADSDGDNMDDYYEMFHGLNPILSDIVDYCNQNTGGMLPPIYTQLSGNDTALPSAKESYDFNVYPWLAGLPNADPDQDGIPNWEEALSPNQPSPANHNTDPSPLWFTDISNTNSYVNLFYGWGSAWNFWAPETFMPDPYQYHPSVDAMSDAYLGSEVLPSGVRIDSVAEMRPSYLYSFEMNEGFDTDNDNLSDRYEINGVSGGVTDPQNVDRPGGRKALYLDGASAARTRGIYAFGLNALRSWTLEAWVMPENPASGKMQVILERPVRWDEADTTPTDEMIRRTFRLGLDENGFPFVEFNNGDKDRITVQAKAREGVEGGDEGALEANRWYHLAATMDGFAGKLALYVDGRRVASTATTAIPYTGFTVSAIDGIGAEYHAPQYAPILIGASDLRPDGYVEQAFEVEPGSDETVSLRYHNGYQIPMGTQASLIRPAEFTPQPALGDFFQGWIDEVRIWSGARPGGEDPTDLRITKWHWPTIKDDYEAMKRYGSDDVMAARNDTVKYLNRAVDLRKRRHDAAAAAAVAGLQEVTVTNNNYYYDATGMTFEEFYALAGRYIQMTGGEDMEIRIAPTLLCVYNFDSLPDPDYQSQTPARFDRLNGRPTDYEGVPWLSGNGNATTVYNAPDYYGVEHTFPQYVQNLVANLPLGHLAPDGTDDFYSPENPDIDFQRDEGFPLFSYRPDHVADSKYWTRDTKGGIALADVAELGGDAADFENVFPNTANPYGNRYETANVVTDQKHPQTQLMETFDPVTGVFYNDLVPLAGARADMSVQLWDDPNGTGFGINNDTDGDGLPDWWELANGMKTDEKDQNSNGKDDWEDDFDGDGLNNYFEYLAGTHPFDATSDGFTADGLADNDDDHLTNLEELALGTHPGRPDTDDDGIDDGDEVAQGTNPCNSLDPFTQNYLHNDGQGWLTIPGRITQKRVNGEFVDRYGTRFDLENWTIDVAVRPTAEVTGDVVLLSRQTEPYGYLNYELGIAANGIPYVLFQTPGGITNRVDGIVPLAVNEWTFLGGRFGPAEVGGGNALTLFVDGVPYVQNVNLATCATGNAPETDGDVIVSKGFEGDIDEVRVWNYAIPNARYVEMYDETIFAGKDIARMGSLNCGVTNAVMTMLYNDELDPVDNVSVEFWFKYDEAGTGNSIVKRGNQSDTTQSFNFSINPDGRLSAMISGFYRMANGIVRTPITLTSINPVSPKDWHHVAVVATGGDSAQDVTAKLWIDGVPQGGSVYEAAIRGTVRYLTPGETYTFASFYKGGVDEFRLWNYARSEKEILDNRNKTIDITAGDRETEGLAVYFDFDDVDQSETPIKVRNRVNDKKYGIVVYESPDPLDKELDPITLDNAMVEFAPLSKILSKLVLYLSFEDGSSYDGEIGEVEDFAHRILGLEDVRNAVNEAYCGRLSDANHIAFALYGGPYSSPAPFRNYYELDTDGDNLPDYWELEIGLNPYFRDQDLNGEDDYLDDFDGDGLVNYFEFLAGTNPRFWSTDMDGVSDAERDSDGDGLTNLREQLLGTNPGFADSDDDGIIDGNEIAYGSDPLDAGDPAYSRAIAFDGDEGTYVEAIGSRVDKDYTIYRVPIVNRYMVDGSFTLSAQVRPTAYPTANDAIIAAYELAGGCYNYYLALSPDGTVKAGFTRASDNSNFILETPAFRALPLNAWTRIEFKFDEESRMATLLIDGEQVAMEPTVSVPFTVVQSLKPSVVFGRGFAGFLRNIKLQVPLEEESTGASAEKTAVEGVKASGNGTLFDYRFSDGTSWDAASGFGTFGHPEISTMQVEDFAFADYYDTIVTNLPFMLRARLNAYVGATIVGNASFVTLDDEGNVLTPALDTDGDGLPDEWEIAHGLNPFNVDSDGDGVTDDKEDSDLDGLENYFEYLAGTDPNNARTDGLTFDGDADGDDDGLTNIEEQLYGTDPGLADTDDDGIADGDEAHGCAENGYTFSLPTSALSPSRQGVLNPNGGCAQFDEASDLAALRLDKSWTVEAWVKPASDSASGEIVSRADIGTGGINYELSLEGGYPCARVIGIYEGTSESALTVYVQALNPIQGGQWSHLAAVWNNDTRVLAIYVNGVLQGDVYERRMDLGVFAQDGLSPVWIGYGFAGAIDEVRIWDIARSGASIGATAYKTFEHAAAQPLVELRFDDFGETVQNFGSLSAARESFARLYSATVELDESSPIAADEYVDADADRIPDFWEIAIFGSVMACDPAGDEDEDGLSNLYEYYSRTYPFTKYTSDALYGSNVGHWKPDDASKDSDSDGLTNLQEQNLGTRPDDWDTDDDGWADYEEVNGVKLLDGTKVGVSDPLNPLSPAQPRAVQFGGDGRVSVPQRDGKSLAEWTVAAWVRPDADQNGEGTVVGRFFPDGSANYEIRIGSEGGTIRPSARYTGVGVSGLPEEILIKFGEEATTIRDDNEDWLALKAGQWTHLAVSYTCTNAIHAVTNGLFTLYVDGTPVAWRQDALPKPWTGAGAGTPLNGELVIGEGFKGLVDDVRVASFKASVDDIVAMMGGSPVLEKPLPSATNEAAAVASALPQAVAGEYIVRFRDGVTKAASTAAVTALGGNVRRTYNIINAAYVVVPQGADADAFVAGIKADPSVLYVEPNMKFFALKAPNDSDYAKLWGLKNSGQTGGTSGCDIKAEDAWEYTTGSKNVVVAVIDTGVDYNHPDLSANMWMNPGEIPGNGVDDDENGFIDDVYGWNFVTGAPNGDPMDDQGHGTHCAGTIGGVGNNGQGVAGVNWNVKIMALKFLAADGGGSTADAVGCVDYAVQMGAKLTSNSWGGGGYSQVLYDAIRASGEAGMLFIAAAGNDGTDNDVMPHYPSSYDLENIIAVAATDHDDEIASFSCYGATSVDIAAPGDNIYSTYPTAFGSYATLSGTSMATPHVAGAAALIYAADPTLTASKVKSLLLEYADPVPSLAGKCVTGARLNIGAIIPVIWNPGGGEEPTLPGTRALSAHYRFDDAGETLHDFAVPFDAFGRVDKRAAVMENVTLVTDADEDLELGRFFGDADEDGLPDWWEEMVGMSPVDANDGDGRNGDPDGDGLSNLFEHLASRGAFRRGERGLDPFNPDTDNDGIADYDEDSDLDNLTNGEEQDDYLSNPGDTDTDDDGVTDGVELGAGFEPTDALNPYASRAITFHGANDDSNIVVVKDKIDGRFTERFSSDEWTVEAWVNPKGASLSGEYALVSRHLFATGAINYELGISGMRPYVRYTDHRGLDEVRIDAGEQLEGTNWVHLAARLEKTGESEMNVLTLFVDGVPVAGTRSGVVSATGPGDLVFGSAGFEGQMFGIRVWNTAQADDTIKGMMRNELIGGTVENLSGVLTVSGDGHLKETAVTTKANGDLIDNFSENWTIECWVRTYSASGIIVARRNQSSATVDNFNYCLQIGPNGGVVGRFAEWYDMYAVSDDGIVSILRGYDYECNNLVGEIRINDGMWHHVAYVRTAKQCLLYVDGVLDVSQNRLVLTPVSETQEIVGYGIRVEPGPVVIGEGLAGSIDEVRIWNRDLSSAEIKDYSARNITGAEGGLVSYFNFDFQEGVLADERSSLRDSASEYGVYIGDAVCDTTAVGPAIVLVPMRSIQGLALAGSFVGRDGGDWVEDRTRPMGEQPFANWKYAGRRASPSTDYLFSMQEPRSWTETVDSDADDLPDWWEVNHGFNPYNADQDGNGVPDGYDDFDRDGLRNEAEYRATLNPWDPDFDNDGLLDYDDSPVPLAANPLSYGWLYTDGDYVLDAYELGWHDVFASAFRYDEHEDRDLDGWDNWSEALVGTRLEYNTYDGDEGMILITHTNHTTAAVQLTTEASPVDKAANFPTPDLMVTVNYFGDRIASLQQTGPTNGGARLVIHAYSHFDMNGWPDAVIAKHFTTDTFPVTIKFTKEDVTYGHLRQGKNWFFAWVEIDGSYVNVNYPIGSDLEHNVNTLESQGSGDWPTWSPNEPAAVADNQFYGIDIGFDLNEITFNLTDKPASFVRSSWDENFGNEMVDEDVDGYEVLIEGDEYFKYKIEWPRTWIHEWDVVNYNLGKWGADGLGFGAHAPSNFMFPDDNSPKLFDVQVRPEAIRRMDPDGITGFVIADHFTNWTHSAFWLKDHDGMPDLYGPVNREIVADARPEFKFRLDPEFTEFEFILEKNGTTIFDKRILAPGRFRNDVSHRRDLVIWKFPYSVGDVIAAADVSTGVSNEFSPGATYAWRVVPYSPVIRSYTATEIQNLAKGEFLTASAEAETGYVNTSGGKGAIDVRVSYPSDMAYKGSSAPFIRVQAFRSKSFNGLPDASIRIATAGTCTIRGLEDGDSYYLRAYIEQDGDLERDNWESWGYYRAGNAAANPFVPVAVKATMLGNVNSPYDITIRDCDTDNDLLPDAYEWAVNNGFALGVAGYAPIVRRTVAYAVSPMAVAAADPVAFVDTDADQIGDYDEFLNGTNPAHADSDGDGIADGLERTLGSAFDATKPQILKITSVSINADGNPVLDWTWGGAASATKGRAMLKMGQTVLYEVQAKVALTDPEWITVRTVSTDEIDGEAVISEEGAPAGVDVSTFRFFRVKLGAE